MIFYIEIHVSSIETINTSDNQLIRPPRRRHGKGYEIFNASIKEKGIVVCALCYELMFQSLCV